MWSGNWFVVAARFVGITLKSQKQIADQSTRPLVFVNITSLRAVVFSLCAAMLLLIAQSSDAQSQFRQIAPNQGYRGSPTSLTNSVGQAVTDFCTYVGWAPDLTDSYLASEQPILGHFRIWAACYLSNGNVISQDRGGTGMFIDWQLICPAGWDPQSNLPGTPYPAYCVKLYPDPVPAKNAGPCNCNGNSPEQTANSNPINVGVGNKFQIETDAAGPGALRFSRTYNSSNAVIGNRIGSQWRHNYERSIALQSSTITTVYVSRPDGKTFYFNLTANGTPVLWGTAGAVWTADADITDQLVALVDGSGAITGWRYTTATEIETYDATGTLLSIIDRAGLTQTLSYSDNTTPINIAPFAGLLIRVTDALGHQLNFTYDNNARIISATDPAGGLYLYAYDNHNNLVSATYPDNRLRAYLYENTSFSNALTGLIDENGNRFAAWAYDSQGRAISSEHAGSVDRVTLGYGSNTTTATDSLGSVRTYSFQTILGVVRNIGVSQPAGAGSATASQSFAYDPNGNVSYRVDFNGHRTNYQYDLSRNLETSRTEGLNAAGSATPETRTITTTWDATWRLPTQTVEKNASGVPLRQTDTAYDSHGNKTSQSIKDIASGNVRTTTWNYTYNASVPGAVDRLVITGPRSDVSDTTTIDYWPPDATCTGSGAGYDKGCRGQIKQSTNALGQVTQYTRYNPHGQIEQIIDPNGLTTTLSYDARQRLTSRSSSDGSSTQTTQYQYDGVGQLTQITQADGSTLTYTYDGAHRLTRIADSLGNHIDYTLDAMGNRTNEAKVDPTGNLTQSLSRTIDALNRVQNIVGQ